MSFLTKPDNHMGKLRWCWVVQSYLLNWLQINIRLGGANNGIYHCGVVKTLMDAKLMPRIICGSSAGSMMGALLCTKKYEDFDYVNI